MHSLWCFVNAERTAHKGKKKTPLIIAVVAVVALFVAFGIFAIKKAPDNRLALAGNYDLIVATDGDIVLGEDELTKSGYRTDDVLIITDTEFSLDFGEIKDSGSWKFEKTNADGSDIYVFHGGVHYYGVHYAIDGVSRVDLTLDLGGMSILFRFKKDTGK